MGARIVAARASGPGRERTQRGCRLTPVTRRGAAMPIPASPSTLSHRCGCAGSVLSAAATPETLAACSVTGGVSVPTVVELYTSGRMQFLPARGPLARRPEGPARHRPTRLPRRLLGPARLEGSLRRPCLHRAPAGDQPARWQSLRLHAAGAGRRCRLAGWPGAAAVTPHPAPVQVTLVEDDAGYLGASSGVRPRRCAWPGSGSSPRTGSSRRSVPGRTPARRCATMRWCASSSSCRRSATCRCASRRAPPPGRGARRQVRFVITDPTSGRPLQAAAADGFGPSLRRAQPPADRH